MAGSRKIVEEARSDMTLHEEPGGSLDDWEVQYLDKPALEASLAVALRGLRINSEVLGEGRLDNK